MSGDETRSTSLLSGPPPVNDPLDVAPLRSCPPPDDFVGSSSRPPKWNKTKRKDKPRIGPFGSPSGLVSGRVSHIQSAYMIPPLYTCRAPSPTEYPSSRRPGSFSFSEVHLEEGARIPLDNFTVSLLARLFIAPMQLPPNSYKFIAHFLEVCRALEVEPSLAIFLNIFYMKHSPRPGFVYLSTRKGFHPPRYSSSHKDWWKKWFWVTPPKETLPFPSFKYPRPESVEVPKSTEDEMLILTRFKDYYEMLAKDRGTGRRRGSDSAQTSESVESEGIFLVD